MKKKHLPLALTFLFLLLSLVPLFYIAVYNHPCADDFSYSAAVANVKGDGFLACLLAAFGQIKRFYFGWQGTYSAVFMMSLSPSAFSEGLYALVPYFLLLLFSLATVFLFKTVLGKYFKAPTLEWLPVSLVTVFLSVQLLPSLVQGFYWYNGAVYYCFYYSLALLDLCLMLLYLKEGKRHRLFLGIFLAAFIGGGNYVTALTLSLSLMLLVLWGFLSKSPRKWGLLIHLLVLLAGFAVSITAPGNAVRQAQFPDSPGLFEAIFLSFESAFFYIKEWASLPLLFGLLFALPYFWRMAKGSAFSFRLPLLVTLLSFCFFAAGFAPPIYAMGYPGDGRLLNILYFSFVLFGMLNGFYWCGWVQKTFGEKICLPGKKLLIPLFLFLCGILTVLSPDASMNIALSSLRSGEAQKYDREIEARIVLYEDPDVADMVVAPLSVRPRALFFEDITADPENWKNISLCNFYQKNTVRLTEEYSE